MRLADFNSVFQVSVGLHLAYTFLPDLHDFYLRRIEDFTNSAAKFAESPPDHFDTSVLKGYVTYLRHLIKDRRREVNSRIIWMQVGATCIASFSLALLIIAGMCPELSVSFKTILLLLLTALVPMPAFCFLSSVSHRAWLQRISSARENVQREWTRLMLPIIEEFKRLGEQ